MLKPPLISLCVAKRGAGKTELTKAILKKNSRWIVYDKMKEYSTKELGGVVCSYFKDFQYLLETEEPKIIFQPYKAGQNIFEYFCFMLLQMSKNYFVIIEEINVLMNETNHHTYSCQLVDEGRHKNIGLHGNCRRPFGISKLFMSQVDAFFLGRITLPEDLKYLRNLGGIPRETFNLINSLKKYCFLRFLPEPERFEKKEEENSFVVMNKKPF